MGTFYFIKETKWSSVSSFDGQRGQQQVTENTSQICWFGAENVSTRFPSLILQGEPGRCWHLLKSLNAMKKNSALLLARQAWAHISMLRPPALFTLLTDSIAPRKEGTWGELVKGRSEGAIVSFKCFKLYNTLVCDVLIDIWGLFSLTFGCPVARPALCFSWLFLVSDSDCTATPLSLVALPPLTVFLTQAATSAGRFYQNTFLERLDRATGRRGYWRLRKFSVWG